MDDGSKSREELLEELQALRAQVQQGETAASETTSSDDAAEPTQQWTRREALGKAAWVAPVILSVSLSGTPAQAQRQRSFLRGPGAPTPFPTAFPTSFPTAFPTSFPTASPTMGPTPAPTAFPTASPTMVPVELQSFKIE